MAVIVLEVTFNDAVPLIPLSDAVMIVEPAAKAVANPTGLIVATAAFVLVQETVEVTFAVD
jgi:hypothetical protein